MLDKLYRKPWLGLLGLAVGFLTQPLGHTAYKILEAACGAQVYVAAGITGVVGLVIIARGLKHEELKATWMGMLGGWILWIGWFEYAFRFFSVLYEVPGFAVEPGVPRGYVAAPQANMLQATVSIMLALLLVYGFLNLQTRCNFMRFFHRNLKLSPGMPTPDNKRSFARITAMELLFVTWFCYQFWLYAIYFGTRGVGAQVVMGLFVPGPPGRVPGLQVHAADPHGGGTALRHRSRHRVMGLRRDAGAFPGLPRVLALPARIPGLQRDPRPAVRRRPGRDRPPAGPGVEACPGRAGPDGHGTLTLPGAAGSGMLSGPES